MEDLKKELSNNLDSLCVTTKDKVDFFVNNLGLSKSQVEALRNISNDDLNDNI